MTELKNCPFCGGEAEDGYYEAYSTDSSFDYIGCTACNAKIPYFCNGRDEAITAWNTRTKDVGDD